MNSRVQTNQQIEATLTNGWKLTPATLANKITRGKWIPARHLLHISTIVATEVAKGGARIIVTMPARHGKSEFLSVNTPTWFLEHWPEKYVMGLSYGLDLATDFSLKVRTNFLDEDNHHLLNTRLRRDKLKIDRFLTTAGGGYTAAGIGGVITGRGADLLFIDDYIKNAEAALSKAQRDSSWEWFLSTAYTRREPGSSIIVLATRWDQDDLIGRMLTEMPEENWQLINLPALAEQNDSLGRAEGEALWPERWPKEELLKTKAALGEYWWQAMYQQNPRPSMSGAMIGDKLRVIKEEDLPHVNNRNRIRAWDLAATDGGGDFTCGPLMSTEKGSSKIYIEDILRHQKSPHGNRLIIRAAAEKDGYSVPIWMEQEPGSAGVTVIDDYKTETLSGWDFKGEKATGPLEVRAGPFLAAIEAGNVYMVEADWNDALRDELNSFPDGDNDDQIVACALGYSKLNRGNYSSVVWGRFSKDVQRQNSQIIKATRIPGEKQRKLTWR